jgi:hypothetical protein
MSFEITLTPYVRVINVESFIESIELIDISPVYTLIQPDADGGRTLQTDLNLDNRILPPRIEEFLGQLSCDDI